MRRAPQTITGYLAQHGVDSSMIGGKQARGMRKSVEITGGRKYLLRRVIAEGGMGVIYEAEDIDCRRIVALKVLSRKPGRSAKDVLRFIAEAQVTSQLEHPNIVPIHELGMDSRGRVFYTMKYIRGRTLAGVLAEIRNGHRPTIEQFPLSRLLNVFQKICDAVAFAHARNVIHRDIKPDNVMLGDYGEVVLMDWGLARTSTESDAADQQADAVSTIRNEAAGAVLKTLSDHVLGSPGFMAPEQIHHKTAVNTRADIYGLGAILYNILALNPTVSGKEIFPVLTRIVTGRFPSPASFNKAGRRKKGPAFPHCPDGLIPPILSDIAMKALATDPDDRYPSVKSLQEEIETYQSGLVWVPVIDEDFTRPGVEERWDIVGGTWQMRNGEFLIHGGEPQLLILKAPVSGDVRIEFECRQESIYLNDVSCFMNAIPARNSKDTAYTGYEFKYGGFENSLILLIRNDTRLWSKGASPIERGKRYNVRAERIGSRLRLVVNDREVFRVDDPQPLSGPERTAVGVYSWRATTRYHRIRIYALQAPWRSDLLDFADRQIQKGGFAIAESLYREIMGTHQDPARTQRAKDGLEVTQRYRGILQELPKIRVRLERAWPGRAIQLALDHDGLALDIAGCGIDDLKPLKGLPLRTLNCQHNHIRSLEPLRGIHLVTLNCEGNPLKNLEPLRGMALKQLVCESCGIRSLEPLRGMPLQLLSAGDNPLGSLKALRGLPLTNLYVWATGISSLEPLRGMALATLDCYANRVRDLAPLHGMPLAAVNCESNGIASLEPLRGAPLRVLHCSQNEISNLEPLRGGGLSHLTCACNRIRDLDPLRGLPLGRLVCGNNQLHRLDPFLDDPPEIFQYDGDSLDDQEIARARTAWNRRKDRAQLVRETDILLALRRGQTDKLVRMATRSGHSAYLYVPKLLSWDNAKLFCEKLGGHLVVIRSQKEHDFLFSLYPVAWAWMGLCVTKQGPEWVTGEPVKFTKFAYRRDEIAPGPKIFARLWSYQSQPGYENPFIVEWNLPKARPSASDTGNKRA